MKDRLPNQWKDKKYLLLITCYVIFTIFLSQIYAQTLSVKGKVTITRYNIQDALVSFIDKTDTTIKYSALTDAAGNYEIAIAGPTSVGSNINTSPSSFELAQNYPNPFTTSTVIPYNVNIQTDIDVTIYDILGREIRRFDIAGISKGVHNILWDGKNNFGQRVANGVYFYKLQAGSESKVRKMIFNSSGKNNFIPMQYNYSSGLSKTNNNAAATTLQKNYTVRIENTSKTLPVIEAQQIENVLIQNDTTINFSVNYIPTAIVNMDSLHQYIRGFGAANIIPWRPEMTDSEIETAFGTGDGQLGFSILRFMVQPDSNQWNLNLSTAKRARDKGVLLFASPWDPPSSMLETVNGQKHLRYDMYEQYAAHLKAFNRYMTNNEIPLYALSVQNEPDYGDWTRWTATEILTFMKNNAQNIGTRIIAPESFQFRRNMSDPILNDSVACANLDIIGGHIYGAGLSAYPLAEKKGKEIWMTEHYTESSHSAQVWPLAFDVATEIQKVMQADMNAYIWWYIVRFYGPIGDGTGSTAYPTEDYARKGEVTKRGYLMSQFSRFIRPGYYRVESSVVPNMSKVSVTVYKEPVSSKIVVVAVNTASAQSKCVVRIQQGIMKTFTPYTTSETKNCEKGIDIGITDGNINFTLEPLSVTTYVSD